MAAEPGATGELAISSHGLTKRFRGGQVAFALLNKIVYLHCFAP